MFRVEKTSLFNHVQRSENVEKNGNVGRRINLFRTFSSKNPVSTREESRAGLDKGNKLAFFTTENQRPYQPRFPPRDPRLFLQTGGFHPRRPTGFPSSSTRISHRPPELFSPGDQEDCLRKASGFLPPTNGGDDSASCCRLLTAPGLRW